MIVIKEIFFIIGHFWPWFLVWFAFYLNGLAYFGWLKKYYPQPSITLFAFLAFLFFSFLNWQLAYLHLISLDQLNLSFYFFSLAAIILIITKKDFSLKKQLGFIKEYLIFSGLIIFWFWLRGFQPNIFGLEKYMDFGFVNSILKSSWLPAKDMWWNGAPINYYYFGHFLSGVFIKLSHLPSAYGYNLFLANIFALAMVLSYVFTFNLLLIDKKLNIKKKKLLATLASLYLNFASNWQTIYGVIAVKLGKYSRSLYWYPDATRFIDYRPHSLDKTIHEFPAYSHIVADLHGHLLALPLDLSLLLVLLAYLTNYPKLKKKTNYLFALLGGIEIGLGFMTNSWDLMGFGCLWGVAVSLNLLIRKEIRYWLITSFISLASFIFTIWPFYSHFTPFFQGFRLVKHHSPLWMWLLLWGQFILPLILATSLGWWRKLNSQLFIFIFSLLAIAFWLLIFPEVIYFKDIYAADFARANTMFKFTYQAYIILSLTSFIFLSKLAKKPIFLYLALLGLILPLSYPLYSIPGYYGHLNPHKWRHGDGFYYLKQQQNGDYRLIKYLQGLKKQVNIVEAVGDSYSQYGRASANSGMVTVLGWPVHEWLWRGQGYAPINLRRQEVANFYQTRDLNYQKNFIHRYQIKYIILGQEEKEKYNRLNTTNLLKLGWVVLRYKNQPLIIKTQL